MYKKMEKKEFFKQLILCTMTLVIGGLGKGFGYINSFLHGIGGILLIVAMLYLMCIFSIWHFSSKKPINSFIMSNVCLIIGMIALVVGSLVKLTFISVLGGFFTAYNFIVLVICMWNIILKYEL